MADQTIVAYIVQNRSAYNPEALREQLIASGHSPEAVDEAFAEVGRSEFGRGPARTTWSDSIGSGSFWAAFIGYILMVLVGWFAIIRAPWDWQGTLLPVMAIAAFVLGIVVVAMDRFDLGIRRGVGCAMTALIGVPFLIVAAIYAYCLVAQPQWP